MLTLQQISDRMEIQDLLYRYADLIDRKRFDELASVFSDDAHVDYSAMGGAVGNRDETIAFLKKVMPMFPATQHSNSNVQIRLDERDPDRATGRVMCFNPQQFPLPRGGTQLVMMGLWYVDEYVRTADGWRIRRRSEEKSWVFNAPDFLKL